MNWQTWHDHWCLLGHKATNQAKLLSAVVVLVKIVFRIFFVQQNLCKTATLEKAESRFSDHLSLMHCRSNVCRETVTLKKTENWFLRPFIAQCRSKVLQNAPIGAFCKGSILQYFWPSLSYHLWFLFCLFLSGRFTPVLLYIYHMSQCMRFPTMWYVRPAICLR